MAIAALCKDLFDKFLNQFGSRSVESFDFGTLYDRVAMGRDGKDLTSERIKLSSKEFDANDTAKGRADGPLGFRGKREIFINSNPGMIPGDPEKAAAYISGVVVQELFHHASRKGRFSDNDSR